MTRADCLAAAEAYFQDGRFMSDLQARVAMPTESDTGSAPPALAGYLTDNIVPSLKALGFDCTIVANPVDGAGPFLIARRIEGTNLPTVLTYGHGDVVSGMEGRWADGLSPWTVTVDGDRWYGRGTADNKGQHTINLAGLAQAIAARRGRLGYNVTVLLEMGEEAGSPGLHALCESHRDLLRADLLLGCDGPRVSAARPTIFLGSRGIVQFTLRLAARDRGFHSGNWGGVLVNPATVIAHAVATMIGRHGQVLVAGLLPPPVSAPVRAALAGMVLGQDPGDPAIDANWGQPGLTPAERLVAWNTLEVLAMGAGTPDRPVNAIPPVAVAHLQLRHVVGTDWQRAGDAIRAHLDAHGFGEVELQVTAASAATRLDVDHPWVAWAARSIEASCGQAPMVLPNLAGSLPNDAFADVLGLPTVWVPHSYPGCAQHAPNEHLLAPVALEGLRVMAGLYWDLGEVGAVWGGLLA